MDNITRLHYLSALGIDVWIPRNVELSDQISIADNDITDDNWERLQADMHACQQCDLCTTRTQVLVGSGNPHADYLWITEAPNLEEDQQGQPFADASNELFIEILRAIQLTKEDVFITHIVKCRPADDHAPKVHQLEACASFLDRQIALLQPKIIVALGRVAAHKLLQSKANLTELRRSEHTYFGIPLIVTYHPKYLLRSLTEKAKTWQDIQRALTLINPNT